MRYKLRNNSPIDGAVYLNETDPPIHLAYREDAERLIAENEKLLAEIRRIRLEINNHLYNFQENMTGLIEGPFRRIAEVETLAKGTS